MEIEKGMKIVEAELGVAVMRAAPLLAVLTDAIAIRAAMRREFELALMRAAARVPEPACSGLLGLPNPDE